MVQSYSFGYSLHCLVYCLELRTKLHLALQQSFSKMYGYTSNVDGIRHALLEEPKLDSEDTKFMLVPYSAFTNYLKIKASKAGICLETR